MLEFIQRIFNRNATLTDVSTHLQTAEDLGQLRVVALKNAEAAAHEYIVGARETIAGLSASIGQHEASIGQASRHLSFIGSELGVVKSK